MPRRPLGAPLPSPSGLSGHAVLALRNVFRRPVTIPVGELDRVRPPGARGALDCHHLDCIHCGRCVKACPVGCLAVNRKEGWLELDLYACIACGLCVDDCPTDCLWFHEGQAPPAEHRVLLRYERHEAPPMVASEDGAAVEAGTADPRRLAMMEAPSAETPPLPETAAELRGLAEDEFDWDESDERFFSAISVVSDLAPGQQQLVRCEVGPYTRGKGEQDVMEVLWMESLEAGRRPLLVNND